MIAANAQISLREITAETVRNICDLKVRADQRHFVADNAESIAEAYFNKNAWFRAIYADDTPIGFIMIADDPDVGQYYIWRFMIDERYQKQGFGRKAFELILDHVRARPKATEVTLSFVPGEGGPEHFYRAFGFVPTGEIDDGEVVARLQF